MKISANPFLEGDNAKVESTTVEISEGNDQGAWCSVLPPGRTAYNPYLTFEFNSTYLIETVKISGLYNPNMYVTALTIQNDTGQGFVFISDNPKVSQFRYTVGAHG